MPRTTLKVLRRFALPVVMAGALAFTAACGSDSDDTSDTAQQSGQETTPDAPPTDAPTGDDLSAGLTGVCKEASQFTEELGTDFTGMTEPGAVRDKAAKFGEFAEKTDDAKLKEVFQGMEEEMNNLATALETQDLEAMQGFSDNWLDLSQQFAEACT